MKLQSCNNTPSFGAIRNKIFLGEFEKTSNSKRAKKIMDSVNEVPAFRSLSNITDIDIILCAKPNAELFVNKPGFQKFLNCTFTIQYEKPANNTIEKIKKFFNPIEKIEIHRSYIDEQSLSDRLVNKFIKYIKASGKDSFESKLEVAQKQIEKLANRKKKGL